MKRRDLINIEGARCSVNGKGDLGVDPAARRLIGAECRVVKQTKAGLIQVYLIDDPEIRLSVPQRNIELVHDEPKKIGEGLWRGMEEFYAEGYERLEHEGFI